MVRIVPPGKTLLDRLLVPLDGSAESEGILSRVVPLARAAAAEVLVVQVVPFLQTLLVMPRSLSRESGRAQDTAAAWDYVTNVAARLRREGVDARGLAALGQPASTVAELAGREQATLVAMRVHGRSRLGRLAFGSVAGKLLRRTKLPLLLARTGRMKASAAKTWVLALPDIPSTLDPFAGVVRDARRTGATLNLVSARGEEEILSAVLSEDADLVLTSRWEPRRLERLLSVLPVPLLVL